MSSVAQMSEIDGFQDEPLAPRRTRGMYVGFATLVTIGLALASWYVGERFWWLRPPTPARSPWHPPKRTQRQPPPRPQPARPHRL